MMLLVGLTIVISPMTAASAIVRPALGRAYHRSTPDRNKTNRQNENAWLKMLSYVP